MTGARTTLATKDEELDEHEVAKMMAGGLEFMDDVDLLENEGFEFEIPEDHIPDWYPSDDDDADLIIDGDLYRVLYKLQGE